LPPLFDFDLMVQTIQPAKEEPGEAQQKTERCVLEGLRKYAPKHVLLVGRPGSGKSTALVRLLLEEAENDFHYAGFGGDLNFVKKLEMQPLKEARIWQFVILEEAQLERLKRA
jgi:putative NADH-flavin reductase